MAPALIADDARHALLRRAHPVTQAEIGAFEAEPDRRMGRILDPGTAYKVEELEARTALTKFALDDETWSLNPYVGCSHDCVYCYVPDVAHVERPRWGSYVIVKRNLPRVLARELRTHERKNIFLSSATDPYQPAEGIYLVTRRCIELILRASWPLRVLTRNPLVRRDIDILARFDDLEIGMSIPTLDDDARRVLEPGAPTVEGRLASIRALADAGLEPFVNLAPTYPFTGGIGPRDIAAVLKEAGAADVYVGPWRYLDGVLPALRARTEGTLYEEFEAAVVDGGYFDRMFRALRAACVREGVRFHTMGDARPGAAARKWRSRPPPQARPTEGGKEFLVKATI